eukprot:862590-Amphidinium_carterae.1
MSTEQETPGGAAGRSEASRSSKLHATLANFDGSWVSQELWWQWDLDFQSDFKRAMRCAKQVVDAPRCSTWHSVTTAHIEGNGCKAQLRHRFEALLHTLQAVTISRKCEDQPLEAESLRTLAQAQILRGEVDEALAAMSLPLAHNIVLFFP